MTKVALRGLARASCGPSLTALAVLPRRGAGGGHLRPHRHDQPLLRRHLRRGARRAPTSRSRRSEPVQPGRAASRRPSRQRCSTACARCDGVEEAAGGDLRARSLRRRRRRPDRAPVRAQLRLLGAARAVRAVHLRRGPPAAERRARRRSTSDRRPRGLRRRRHAAHGRRRRGSRATGSSGITGWATPRSAAPASPQLTLPEAQRVTDKRRQVRPDLGGRRGRGDARRAQARGSQRVLPPHGARGDRPARTPTRQSRRHRGRPELPDDRAARVRAACRCSSARS